MSYHHVTAVQLRSIADRMDSLQHCIVGVNGADLAISDRKTVKVLRVLGIDDLVVQVSE